MRERKSETEIVKPIRTIEKQQSFKPKPHAVFNVAYVVIIVVVVL